MSDKQKNAKGLLGRRIAFDRRKRLTNGTGIYRTVERCSGIPRVPDSERRSCSGVGLGNITDFESEKCNEGDASLLRRTIADAD